MPEIQELRVVGKPSVAQDIIMVIITITTEKQTNLICLNSRHNDVEEIVVETNMTIVETGPAQVEVPAIITIGGQTDTMIVDMAEVT